VKQQFDPMWESVKLYFVIICCTILSMFLMHIVATSDKPELTGMVLLVITAPVGFICVKWMKEKVDEFRDQ